MFKTPVKVSSRKGGSLDSWFRVQPTMTTPLFYLTLKHVIASHSCPQNPRFLLISQNAFSLSLTVPTVFNISTTIPMSLLKHKTEI